MLQHLSRLTSTGLRTSPPGASGRKYAV